MVRLGAGDSSRVPLLADSMHAIPTPLPTDPPPGRLDPHPSMGMSQFMSDSVCIARHGRAVNVAFLDGHARTVHLAELWRLKWNNAWVDTTSPSRRSNFQVHPWAAPATPHKPRRARRAVDTRTTSAR